MVINQKSVSKKDIREEKKNQRRNMPKEKRLYLSRIIEKKVASLTEFLESDVVFLYYPVRNEVDVRELIEYSLYLDKKVLIPKVKENSTMDFYEINSFKDLEEGYKGIKEPTVTEVPYMENDSEKTFMVAPGVAFDKHLSRIGMGKGFYDKYLQQHKIKKVCGVAYEFQMIDTIPNELHDAKMDLVITQNNIYY